MTLKIYNTMTRRREVFEPQQPGKVGMYACGVTVYDLSHIGHARAMVVFDVIQRYLRRLGCEVTFVRNYTDIDDKIINRANEEGVAWNEISERYIAEFDKDMAALGIQTPEHTPRATEHIDGMLTMVQALIERGHAYEVDGDVYFDVLSFKEYGKLSGKDIESCSPAHGLMSMIARKAHWISHFGKLPNRANLHGKAPGDRAVPAGTSSARS